MREGGFKLKKK